MLIKFQTDKKLVGRKGTSLGEADNGTCNYTNKNKGGLKREKRGQRTTKNNN